MDKTELTSSASERTLNLRRAWCLMPLISLLLVFGIGEFVRPAAGFFPITFDAQFDWIAQCPEVIELGGPIYLRSPAGSLEAFGGDVSGRVRWAAAAAVSIALGLMTLLVSAVIVARQLGSIMKRPVRTILVATGVLAATSAVVMSLDVARGILPAISIACIIVAIGGHATNRPLGVIASVILVLATAAWVITELPIHAWVADELSGNRYRTFALTTPLFDRLQAVLYSSHIGWPWFDRAIGGLSVIVVVTLAIAVCALVAACRSESHQLEDAQLRERAESLRLLLYLGGGVLVGGVVYIKMLHNWPLALLCDKQAVTLFTGLSNHWPVIVATYWSLMLVAIFVPAQISLARAARQLARAQLQGGKAPVSEKLVDEWLDERGLRASPAKQIAQFVALLSPWLTSVPVAALFDYFKQAAVN
jgi:hypothetical protein